LTNDLLRIQVKLLSNAPRGLNLDPFLEIFARWRVEKNHPAEWVDLADYAHVPRGPGILLAGKNCNFAFDMADPAPGTLCFVKKGLSGSPAARIASAIRSALELSKRLVAEREFPSGVRLQTDALLLSFPDRLATPHNAATDAVLRPPMQRALDALFTANGYTLTQEPDAKAPYGFSVRAKKAEPLDALLARITGAALS
jgi:hypothetical protein